MQVHQACNVVVTPQQAVMRSDFPQYRGSKVRYCRGIEAFVDPITLEAIIPRIRKAFI